MPALPDFLSRKLAEDAFHLALRLTQQDFTCNDFEDPEAFVHTVEGKIVLLDARGDLLVEIGSFALYQVDTDGMVAQDVSIYQAFDVCQETYDYYQDLVDYETQWDFQLKVLKTLDCVGEVLPFGMLIVSDLWLEPAYRGREFGLMALKSIIQRFRMGVGIFAMRPFPLQHAEGVDPQVKADMSSYTGSSRACLMKLRAHFAQLGFKLVPGTDVMALQGVAKMNNLVIDPWRP